jgi:hypothetical protein
MGSDSAMRRRSAAEKCGYQQQKFKPALVATSVPRLPRTVQTKSGSMSDSLT